MTAARRSPSASDSASTSTSAQLSLWDAVSIIIGIVIGTAIFKTPQLVFGNVPGPWTGMLVWLLGGVLALVGATCYAELATTYPRSGGDYVYLTRAYGRPAGFLFGWAQLAVILTGNIGAMAYAFADYAGALFGQLGDSHVWFASVAVVGLTVLNLFGVVHGKAAQNVLTLAKLIGLAGILAAGLIWGESGSLAVEQPMSGPGLGLALVFVLYAYGGWNDSAFVAAEVRDRRKNMPRALLLGVAGITLIYLVVNGAYLRGLGFEGLRRSPAPAADVLQLALGDWGSKAMSLVVMTSALGAINGLTLTGSRVYAALGAEHPLFARLGRWHAGRNAPVWSLLVQGAVSLGLILAVGTEPGRDVVDWGVARLHAAILAVADPLFPNDIVDSVFGPEALTGLPWKHYFGGFNTLVAATAPVFWLFFLLTGVSLFVLRRKDPDLERPFGAPFYPLSPLVFCLTCGYMLYSSLDYARALSLLGLIPLAIGLPLYWLSQSQKSAAGDAD